MEASLIIFLFLVLICEVIGTISGFGASVFLVPLAGVFFDFKTALVLSGIVFIFSSSSKLFIFRKHINFPLILKIGIPSVIFTLLGAYLNNKVDLKIAELAMGIFLIAFAIAFLIKPDLKLKADGIKAIGGGIASGFFTGFIGTGGAIRGATLSAFNLSKNVFVSTSAGIDIGGDIGRSIIYIVNGYLDKKYIWFIPVMLVLAYSGSWLGKKLLNNISEIIFKKLVLVLILGIGAFMIYGFITGKKVIH
ncbi:sulfite exporter TauE/SafE family protein [Chitinophaga pendula]|uniref:sulfite exporter TauE/SafE family protein n=1 Tax=Chitinophaga TaxID=79328 RepID=UPI000BAEDEA8|nr:MULTISPECIES: sulfite exporter TauE/SafE family protein [Chitinophaga]ASZ09594.1 hypothetical protein CK934_00680 [Chitinophaga sp. MD30]UCJ07472.1 sulfite exporter TauE/SafE family protein [Chitinophaga pendula]